MSGTGCVPVLLYFIYCVCIVSDWGKCHVTRAVYQHQTPPRVQIFSVLAIFVFVL